MMVYNAKIHFGICLVVFISIILIILYLDCVLCSYDNKERIFGTFILKDKLLFMDKIYFYKVTTITEFSLR